MDPWRGPDGVDGVEGQQPTRDHPLLANPVETDRRPAALDASPDDGAVGHDGDIISIAHQHIPGVHPKRPPSKLSPTREVSEDSVSAPVVTGNGIATRHVPRDVLGQQGSEGVRVPADVESALGSVEPVHDLHCPSSIHAAHPDANL